MNHQRLIAAGFVFLSQAAIASSLTIEAGVALVESSGLRRYAAKRFLTNNETSSLAAPQLRVSMPVGESWVVGAGYAYYATFRGSGGAPTPDVFDEGLIVIQIPVIFSSSEKIHEASLDLRYRWHLSERASVDAGPTLSLFHSKATIWTRSFSATDLRLGGVVQLKYALSEAWTAGVAYRYAAPPDRTLNIFALTVSWSP